MSGFSVYLDNMIIDHIFKGTFFYTPTKYLALFTSSEGLATNTESTWASKELPSSAGSYSRLALPDTLWSDAVYGSTSNTSELVYPVATSTWGTVTHIGILDSDTGGNVLAWGAIVNPSTNVEEGRNIQTGDQLIIRPSALTVKLM